jgi:type IV fimbrial biogenesis protein FimT
VKIRSRVALCPSEDGVSCAAVHWDRGFIVFHDANNNGSRDAAETVVNRWQALATQLRASGNANVANYVSYTPLGNTRMVSGAFQSGTLTFCQLSAQPTQARDIVISADGRPRVQRRTVSTCT